MEKYVPDLLTALIVNIIVAILLGAAAIFWKWLKKLREPSNGALLQGDWFSYYYRLENDQPLLKKDKWKIKKSALNSSSYRVWIFDSTRTGKPGRGLRERLKNIGKRLKNTRKNGGGILWKIRSVFVGDYIGIGKVVLDDQDSCYTARLIVRSIYPVYIRFLRPTVDTHGNNVLRGVALATDENNCIRSGVNILATRRLTEDALMEILEKTSYVYSPQGFLKLKPESLNGS